MESEVAGSADAGPVGEGVPAEEPRTVAIWELADGAVPQPNDLFRDAASGLLKVPVTDDLSPAEGALRTWLNTQTGWASTAQMSVDFTGPIDATTVTPETVQVWRWGTQPVQLTAEDALWTVSDDGQRVTIDPTRAGWSLAATYVGLVRGGPKGVLDMAGKPVQARRAGRVWAVFANSC